MIWLIKSGVKTGKQNWTVFIPMAFPKKNAYEGDFMLRNYVTYEETIYSK